MTEEPAFPFKEQRIYHMHNLLTVVKDKPLVARTLTWDLSRVVRQYNSISITCPFIA